MAELVAWLREAQELKRLHPLLVIASQNKGLVET
jgi:hypothetical protein